MLFWISAIIYEFGSDKFIPVTFDEKGNVIKHNQKVLKLGLDGKYSNLPLGIITTENLPSVSLLTQNPKVRTLRHEISVRVIDANQLYFADTSRRHMHKPKYSSGATIHTSIEKNIEHLVQKRLYDINNTYSIQLAQFFNPFNEEQQREYSMLIKNYLDPLLAKDGLIVHWAEFKID